MSEARVALIRARLQAAFAPLELDVIDDSARHAGHAGARDGRGHFSVRIVSAAFVGMAPLARHRAVYAALGALMDSDIHALQIEAAPPAGPEPGIGCRRARPSRDAPETRFNEFQQVVQTLQA
ncbi:BolA-like protein [mine drainage metagenome]|uniref:BolA-like protein n=1 Tax=mine drainage metagenome TaxID=410659 RepID=T1B4C0_9ZZZZ